MVCLNPTGDTARGGELVSPPGVARCDRDSRPPARIAERVTPSGTGTRFQKTVSSIHWAERISQARSAGETCFSDNSVRVFVWMFETVKRC